MERFQHIVRFSSFAHTHDESFFVDTPIDPKSTGAIGWSMVHGSVTTFTDTLPMFYHIEWDKEYMVPINIHTYAMNVTEANMHPGSRPLWKPIHDFKKTYSLADLSPKAIQALTLRFFNDLDSAERFEKSFNPREKYYLLFKSGNSDFSADLHDPFYKCLQVSEEYERYDCLMKEVGSKWWDPVGLY